MKILYKKRPRGKGVQNDKENPAVLLNCEPPTSVV